MPAMSTPVRASDRDLRAGSRLAKLSRRDARSTAWIQLPRAGHWSARKAAKCSTPAVRVVNEPALDFMYGAMRQCIRSRPGHWTTHLGEPSGSSGHRRLCRIASLPAIAPDWWPLLLTGPRAPAGGPVKTGCKYQYLSVTAWPAFVAEPIRLSA